MSTTDYNLPNLIRVLMLADQFYQNGPVVLSQLMRFVEDGLEEIQLGGAKKWFCDRKTFDKYRLLTRKTQVPANFARIMSSIKKPAYHLIIQYLEQVQPGSTDIE